MGASHSKSVLYSAGQDGTPLAMTDGRRWVMEALVQVGGAILGLGVGLAAARLALTGVLAATFGRR
jgi:hypothetical protein